MCMATLERAPDPVCQMRAEAVPLTGRADRVSVDDAVAAWEADVAHAGSKTEPERKAMRIGIAAMWELLEACLPKRTKPGAINSLLAHAVHPVKCLQVFAQQQSQTAHAQAAVLAQP